MSARPAAPGTRRYTHQPTPAPRSIDRLHDCIFNALHSRCLVYNACWEDPAVDRRALALGPQDRVMAIASAGCNVLDYLLVEPAAVHAVDMNPRQIALLELKVAGIRALEFEDFFALFGRGRHGRFQALYRAALRPRLSAFAQGYWDRQGKVFLAAPEALGGLYFHGLSGKVARAFHLYLNFQPRLREGIDALLASTTLAAQREAFDERVLPHMWSSRIDWLLSRQLTMNMLGVPHPQRKQVQAQHAEGVAAFIREAISYVFRELPVGDNYFWRLYLEGRYSEDCCPEYLKAANFGRLKHGLLDRLSLHTCSVTEFLRECREPVSRFVLLDHMDWMSSYLPAALAEEWRYILERAAPGARVIFRSAHAEPRYLESVEVPGAGGRGPVLEHLSFQRQLAASLQAADRVHTYAGFHIADLAA